MITNIADVLRILETDYKILSVKDTVQIIFKDGVVEVPLTLWDKAIMLHTIPLYEQEMRYTRWEIS
jgi:hypothetical protein